MDEQDKSLDENNTNDSPQVVEVNDSTLTPMDSDPTVESKPSVEAEPAFEQTVEVDTNNAAEYADKPSLEEVMPETPVVENVESVSEAPVVLSAPIIEKPKKKRNLAKVIGTILLVWLFVAAPVGAYLWRDKVAYDAEQKKDTEIAGLNAKVTDLQSQLDAELAKETGACSEVKPTNAVLDNIKASITSGNTQPLEGYMASGVDVILAASEGIGETTPTEAVKNVTDFIKDAGTWDFALSDSTMASYQGGDYKQYFPETAIVGKSTTGKVISFSFDCTAKIGTVFLSTTEDVLK